MRVAAIDIGSNSIKLAVAEQVLVDPGDANSAYSFQVIRREKEPVRLGKGTLKTGELSADAIQRALACLRSFKTIAENCGATEIRTIATASIREAKNRAEFVREARSKLGLKIEVLSGIEEARLIGTSVVRGLSAGKSTLLNIDIGGGSTELSLMNRGSVQKLFSIKVGAVRLTEEFLSADRSRSDPASQKDVARALAEIEGALDTPYREMKSMKWQIASATSGSALAIAKILGVGTDATAKIELTKVRELRKKLSGMSVAERAKLPGVSQQRSEIILAGALILEAVMTRLKIDAIVPCSWALREGAIIEMIREKEGVAIGIPGQNSRSMRRFEEVEAADGSTDDRSITQMGSAHWP